MPIFQQIYLPKSITFLYYIFQIYINWMNFIVNLMFPLATLLTLNIKIYQGLQKLRKPYPSPRPTTKSLNSPQEIPKERASLIRTPIFRKSENRQNLSSNMTSMTEDEARIFFSFFFSILGYSLYISYISHWYIFGREYFFVDLGLFFSL